MGLVRNGCKFAPVLQFRIDNDPALAFFPDMVIGNHRPTLHFGNFTLVTSHPPAHATIPQPPNAYPFICDVFRGFSRGWR